jgi:sensor histidine kinase regulating citrate/malate metabolism
MNKKAVESEELEAREYSFRPLTEAIVVGLVFFAAIFITTFFIYHHALEAQKGEIREGLLRTGEVLATFVDGDVHDTFRNQDQKDSAAYQEAVRPLRQAMEADPTIPFVYTTVLKDGKVYFVLDPVPPEDPDAVAIMEEYTDASLELKEALMNEETTTSREPYTDEWGSFVSGHIPIYDSQDNFVGVLSIDIDATSYFERLAPIKRATVRAMVTGFFISYLIAALVWFMRNFSAVINEKRIAIIRKLKGEAGPR